MWRWSQSDGPMAPPSKARKLRDSVYASHPDSRDVNGRRTITSRP